MESFLAKALDHLAEIMLIGIILFLCWMMRAHPPYCRQSVISNYIFTPNAQTI